MGRVERTHILHTHPNPNPPPINPPLNRSLRENDHLGRNRTSYRITVRQLESLVRLSEVMVVEGAERGEEKGWGALTVCNCVCGPTRPVSIEPTHRLNNYQTIQQGPGPPAPGRDGAAPLRGGGVPAAQEVGHPRAGRGRDAGGGGGGRGGGGGGWGLWMVFGGGWLVLCVFCGWAWVLCLLE